MCVVGTSKFEPYHTVTWGFDTWVGHLVLRKSWWTISANNLSLGAAIVSLIYC